MKIVVVSDTHIHDKTGQLPAKLAQEMKLADMVIHAGDFVTMATLEKIKSLSKNLKAVSGNMDSDEVKAALPKKEVFKLGRYSVGLTHGYGAPNNIAAVISEEFKGEKLDLVIFGHTHSAMNKKIGDTLFFNPGSPTDKIFAAANSFGVIELNDKIITKIIEV